MLAAALGGMFPSSKIHTGVNKPVMLILSNHQNA